jgi:hypothetical protein
VIPSSRAPRPVAAHYRRSRDDEDDSGHRRSPARHAEQRHSRGRGKRPGDQHSEHNKPDHHLAGVALELPQIEAKARVVKDDRHRQGHQRLECWPEQPLRVDVCSQRAGDETCRQQHNDRGNTQPAGQHLRADGEHEDQADADQHLVCRHVSFP